MCCCWCVFRYFVVADVHLIDGLRLEHGPICKAALMCGLVQNHGVFHVVPSVGDDGDDRVGPVREGVHTVGVVQPWTNYGRLTGLQSVQFVVRTVL